MTNFKIGPKIIPLSDVETIGSIERWKNNVTYHLRQNNDFLPYLQGHFGKKSKATPCRALTDEIKTETVGDETITSVVNSKVDKCFIVDMMLDQIANHCPLIPRNDIIRDSASLTDVWSKIKLYHNLEKSGALMNECWNVKRKPDETPQALFARLKQTYDENLLAAGGLDHVDGKLQEDEEMSPSLHNSIILQWLEILHPQLRDAVTTRFSTQLRNCTYASLFPEISRSVCSLLEELKGEAISNRAFTKPHYRSYQDRTTYRPSSQNSEKKLCEYCKATGKKAFYTHNIQDCLFIKKENSRNSSSAKQVDLSDDVDLLQEQYDEFFRLTEEIPDHDAKRVIEHVITCTVSTDASPTLNLSKNNKSYQFILDTGCTGNIFDDVTANDLNCEIKPTRQRARTADGKMMNIVGETEITLYRDSKPYHLSALVCSDPTDLLLGVPFLKDNDIAIRPATNQLIINGKEFIHYDPVRKARPVKANLVTQFVIQSSKRQIILPGESGIFSVHGLVSDEEIAVEPRWNTHCNKMATKDSELWPRPQIVSVNNGTILLPNDTKEAVIVKRTEHIGQIQLKVPDAEGILLQESSDMITNAPIHSAKKSDFSALVSLNPDKILPPSDEAAFRNLLRTYDQVFSPVTSTYNGNMGPCFVEVNIGKNIPPQRKGRIPFYGRDNLQMLQSKFDELEAKVVFSRPQEIGVTVENTNPSFLVNKQNSPDKRLVTDFSSISDFCRPTPSLLPDVNSTLRSIGGWKYIIKSDMSSAYFQIKLKKSSKRYCGVHTPYRGLRVYNVGCMGLPGVEIALEELTCLLVGDLVKENKVAKVADDIFIGGRTPKELIQNFEVVLDRLLLANIKLSPSKTIIAPKSLSLLGWIWSSGKMSASSHRLTALSTCSLPETVSALKSYLGAYRFISRVLPEHGKLLAPLENIIRGKNGKENISWTSDLQEAFHKTQQALVNAKTITIPIPSDTLWIVTDASLRPGGVGATLYSVRNGTALLSGHFNAKLPEYQARWLPCEVEGLSIAAAMNHWGPLIRQSKEKPQILTDSKPCVQAAQKLRRGEFSASSRLTTFLSTISRYGGQIQHIPGSINLPSDYASRNPLVCSSPDICQVCKFISSTSEAVVNDVSVSDIIDGRASLPFTNRKAWKDIQSECPDLRKVFSFKKNGTVPSKKSKNLRAVRRYISSNVLISNDGLLVHRHVKPFSSHEQIVVPQQVLDGILTALHLQLKHPSAFQLTKVFSRYFFCLNTEKAVAAVSNYCHHCASIKEIPKSLIEQSTCEPPPSVGCNYSADIIKRCKQLIFIIRETTTSYTLAEHIEAESAKEISNVLVKLCNILKPSKLAPITVRVDPAAAHKSLYLSSSRDSELSRNNIQLELGRSVNPNKNPVIDKCIKEVQREIVNIKPDGGPITPLQLSKAVANLNGRIRSSGLSSYELWTQRDQVTGEQLPLSDRELIIKQYHRRQANHPSSERSKAGNKSVLPSPKVKIGSLVYIYADRDKTEPRHRYMVTNITDKSLMIRKFTAKLFSKKEIEVKPSEVYVVPEYNKEFIPIDSDSSSDDEWNIPDSAEFEGLQSQRKHSPHTHEQTRVPLNPASDEQDSEGEPSSHEDSNDSDGEIVLKDDHSDNLREHPPVEVLDPAKRKSIGVAGRLRKRKNINYDMDNIDSDE